MTDISSSTILHIQNLLPNDTLKELQSVLSSSDFPWYWNETTVGKDRYEGGDTPQFTHSFMMYRNVNSDWFHLIEPIFTSVQSALEKNFELQRAKANLLYPIGKTNTNPAHADEEKTPDDDFYSFVYYPFNCDGDTILYKEFFKDIETNKRTIEKTVAPLENSCIFFNSNRLHASSNPIKFTRRIIINFIVKAV